MADGHHQSDDVPDFMVEFTCSIKTESYVEAFEWFAKQLSCHHELLDVLCAAFDSSWKPLLIGLCWAAEHNLLDTLDLLIIQPTSSTSSPTHPKTERKEGDKDHEHASRSSAKSTIV